MPIIHARVDTDTAEAVEAWAGAVGAPVEDIAGDCIDRVVDDDRDTDDPPNVTVNDPFDDEHTADDNDRLSDGDENDVATLHHYRRQVPSSWCVTLRIPDDTETARSAYGGHPIFHAAVDVVARTAVGDGSSIERDDVDTILRREAGSSFDIPVSLLFGVGHDPEDTADALTDALDDVANGGNGGGMGGVMF